MYLPECAKNQRWGVHLLRSHLGEDGQPVNLREHPVDNDSIELLGEHIETHPDDLNNRQNFASALLVLGRFQEATSHFEVLVRNDPANAALLAQLAWCQWKTGKQQEARENFENARQLAPDHPMVRRVAPMFEGEGDLPDPKEASP